MKKLLLFTIFCGSLWGQINNPQPGSATFSGVPSGSCSAAQTAVDTTTGNFYDCLSNVWTLVGPAAGGTGTVTSVSDLSPLFTTATRTTTPAFSLSNAAANTVFGNNTGSSAAPGFQSLVLAQLPVSGSLTVIDHNGAFRHTQRFTGIQAMHMHKSPALAVACTRFYAYFLSHVKGHSWKRSALENQLR